MSKSSSLNAQILIVGAGACGLQTAKTLVDDGFTNVHIITQAELPGGVWAPGDAGQAYEGVMTNSTLGDYEGSAMPMEESLEKVLANDGRISGETCINYFHTFYEKFVKDRVASVRYGLQVTFMNRPSSGSGWLLRFLDVKTGKEIEEEWEKVILCLGQNSVPFVPIGLSDPSKFKGIFSHSSQVTKAVDEKILALPDSSKVVVVGTGKSAVDLAGRYTLAGKEVTVVFNHTKMYYASKGKPLDHFPRTRLFGTLNPPQELTTRFEKFLHRSILGGWIVHKFMGTVVKMAESALQISLESPIRHQLGVLWTGSSQSGGRAVTLPNAFHALHAEGKIKTIGPGVSAVEFSANGRELLLSNGETVEADVIISCTGFSSPYDFIPLDRRIQLGIEPVAPTSPPSENKSLEGFRSLQNPPAPPNGQFAPHVYRGMVPVGALEEKDLAINGAVFCLNALLAFDIQSHWISSFLLNPSDLSLPTPSDAYKICEKRADWQRARYPITKNPYGVQKDIPWMNTDQWMESLLRDMRVNDRRRDPGIFGLGFYFGEMKPSTFRTLSEERRVAREKRERRV